MSKENKKNVLVGKFNGEKNDNEVEEVKEPGRLSKVLTGIKTYGPKVAIGAATIGVGVICYSLGMHAGDNTIRVSRETPSSGIDEDDVYDYRETEETKEE